MKQPVPDPNSLSADIFMKYLDTFVLSLVIVGILVFAGFQISQAYLMFTKFIVIIL